MYMELNVIVLIPKWVISVVYPQPTWAIKRSYNQLLEVYWISHETNSDDELVDDQYITENMRL